MSGSVPIFEDVDVCSQKAIDYEKQLDVYRIEEEIRNINVDSSQDISHMQSQSDYPQRLFLGNVEVQKNHSIIEMSYK